MGQWRGQLLPSGEVALPGRQCILSCGEKSSNGTSIPATWSASGGANGAVSDNWLESFHDPGLDAVVAEAIKNNLDLQQAAGKVTVARQNVTIVGSQLKPQVGAHFSGAGTHTADPINSFQSNMESAGASWEIDVWGRLRSQQAAARASFEALTLDYSFARQSLAATTAKSWYLTIESRQLLELAGQSVGFYAGLLNLARVQASAGKVSDLDLAEASASLNEAESRLEWHKVSTASHGAIWKCSSVVIPPRNWRSARTPFQFRPRSKPAYLPH